MQWGLLHDGYKTLSRAVRPMGCEVKVMLRFNPVLQGAILATLTLFIQPLPGHAQATPEPMFAPEEFVQGTLVHRAFLGVGVREIDAERAKALHIKEEYGVEVLRVDEGSPAESAGIKAG